MPDLLFRLRTIVGAAMAASLCCVLITGCADEVTGGGDDTPEGVKLILASGDGASIDAPAWIDNDRIIFSWNQDPPIKQLWTIRVSGGNPVRFIVDNPNPYLHAAYSPDLGMVAFEVVEGDFAGSNIDASTLGANPRLRTRYVAGGTDSSATYPCWGPGGNALGFLQIGQFGDKQITTRRFVMRELNKSYQPPRLLENTLVIDFGKEFNHSETTWYAPAGGDPFSGKVAYTRIPLDAQEGTEIYYHDLDTGQNIRLTDDNTPDGANNVNPSWSPDGAHIVYSTDYRTTSSPEFLRELFVVSVATKAAARLTRTGANESQPAWSPDGTKLAYVSDGDLYTLVIDTKFFPK